MGSLGEGADLPRSRSTRRSFWSKLSGWQQVLAAVVAAAAAIAAAAIPLVVGQKANDDKSQRYAREVKIVQVKRLAGNKAGTGIERWRIIGTARGLSRLESVYILLVHTDANAAALEMSGIPGNAPAEIHGPAHASSTSDPTVEENWSITITPRPSAGKRGLKIEAVTLASECVNCVFKTRIYVSEELPDAARIVNPSGLRITARSKAVVVG
jgi:hypothetical protein